LPIADDTEAQNCKEFGCLPVDVGAINGRQRPVKLEREGVVVAQGGFRVAIDALDRLDAANNRCGIYKAEMRWSMRVGFCLGIGYVGFFGQP
jgi:hypothetical protein